MDHGIEQEDRGLIRILTLSHPAKRNALDPELLRELHAKVTAPLGEARVLLLRGEGDKAFCSGFDLTSLDAPLSDALPDDAVGALMNALEQLSIPTVALVRGAAFGAGCELACACDLRVGSHDAVFCLPPARLGVIYAPDGLRRVRSLTGLSRAKRMFLTGCRVPASQAVEWGLLDEAHDSTQVEARALLLCEQLAQGAPLAVSGMKRAFHRLELSGSAEEDPAQRTERRRAFESEDAAEGRAAFRERRAPLFKGR